MRKIVDSLRDQQDARAIATGARNGATLVADGYRFRTCARVITAATIENGRFFCERLGDLTGAEYVARYIDVLDPKEAEKARPVAAYVIAAVRDSNTGDVRYVCSCPAWRRAWAYQERRAPGGCICFGQCKHTRGLALAIAATIPLADLVAELRDPPRRDPPLSLRRGGEMGRFACAQNAPPPQREGRRASAGTVRPVALGRDERGRPCLDWKTGAAGDPRNEHDW